VLKPYVRPAPSPIDPLIEALPESVQEGLDTAGDVVEGAAGETLAYVQQNKRTTAYIALGFLVVGLILTSINRRKRRIKVGETDLF
jgi:mannose/fructose/N-acetylgalactosamine-specific phosphotransferase system component IIC